MSIHTSKDLFSALQEIYDLVEKAAKLSDEVFSDDLCGRLYDATRPIDKRMSEVIHSTLKSCGSAVDDALSSARGKFNASVSAAIDVRHIVSSRYRSDEISF